MSPHHIHPRRKDRSRNESWIRDLLHQGEAGTLVTVEDGRPFPIVLNYLYDEEREAVYFHTGKKGRSLSNFQAGGGGGAGVALSVFQMGRLLPADEALEFGVEYRSVVVFGRGVVVEDPEEAEKALVGIMEKYAPHLKAGEDYRPVAPEEIRRTAVLRLDIEAWSGKEKVEAQDFPGAYRLEEVR